MEQSIDRFSLGDIMESSASHVKRTRFDSKRLFEDDVETDELIDQLASDVDKTGTVGLSKYVDTAMQDKGFDTGTYTITPNFIDGEAIAITLVIYTSNPKQTQDAEEVLDTFMQDVETVPEESSQNRLIIKGYGIKENVAELILELSTFGSSNPWGEVFDFYQSEYFKDYSDINDYINKTADNLWTSYDLDLAMYAIDAEKIIYGGVPKATLRKDVDALEGYIFNKDKVNREKLMVELIKFAGNNGDPKKFIVDYGIEDLPELNS